MFVGMSKFTSGFDKPGALLTPLLFVLLGLFSPQAFGSPTVRDGIYLDTESFPSKEQIELLKATTGKLKLTGSEATKLVADYRASSSYEVIFERYTEDLFTLLNIDSFEYEEWQRKNPKITKAIQNYVGSSDESLANEDGLNWLSLNRKMWKRKKLKANEKNFLSEILEGIKPLPKVKGLVFRGMRMDDVEFSSIKDNHHWPQSGLVSTSIDPRVAQSFGYNPVTAQRTVLVIKALGGAPVSPLTFDGGFEGQPGRIDEREVLLEPGSTLFVHFKVQDQAERTSYIFAEELKGTP